MHTFANFIVQLVEDVVEVLELVFDTLLVIDCARRRCLRSLCQSGESNFLASRARLLMMHHCPEHIRLLLAHLLLVCSGSLRSGDDFGFCPRESMCFFTFRCGCNLETSWLCLLYFKHTSTGHLALSWNRRLLQTCCFSFRCLRFFGCLSGRLGRSMTPLHVLLQLLIRDESATALLEGTD